MIGQMSLPDKMLLPHLPKIYPPLLIFVCQPVPSGYQGLSLIGERYLYRLPLLNYWILTIAFLWVHHFFPFVARRLVCFEGNSTPTPDFWLFANRTIKKPFSRKVMLLGMPGFILVHDLAAHRAAHGDKPLPFCAANISSGNTDESCAIVRLACLQGNRPPRFQFAQVRDLQITDFYKTILIFMYAMSSSAMYLSLLKDQLLS